MIASELGIRRNRKDAMAQWVDIQKRDFRALLT
jgi:hypothetical protein